VEGGSCSSQILWGRGEFATSRILWKDSRLIICQMYEWLCTAFGLVTGFIVHTADNCTSPFTVTQKLQHQQSCLHYLLLSSSFSYQLSTLDWTPHTYHKTPLSIVGLPGAHRKLFVMYCLPCCWVAIITWWCHHVFTGCCVATASLLASQCVPWANMPQYYLKVGCLHPVACTRSGSGFPSNATLVWIFYSVIE
jgi:hypothetical protein